MTSYPAPHEDPMPGAPEYIEGPPEKKPADLTTHEALVAYARELLGTVMTGDHVPVIVDRFCREEISAPLSPVEWREMFNPGSLRRIDIPRAGDLVRFTFQGIYDRHWYGIVSHVEGEKASVILSQSLRADVETELREVEMQYNWRRGWSLNNSWPVTSIVRL